MAARMKVLVLYRDDDGDWRWSFKSGNGLVTADSSEGYGKRTSAEHAAGLVLGGTVARSNADGSKAHVIGRDDVRVEVHADRPVEVK